MKKQLTLLLLFTSFTLVFAQKQEVNIKIEKDTIRVSNATELRKAIKSNSVILLTKKIVLDEEKFILSQISNLEIIGDTKEQTELITNNAGNSVIVVEKSKNITFTNLSIGHKEAGYCEGNVVDITNSESIFFYDCDLFGSGVLGLNLHYATVWCYNTVIRDCSEDIINLNQAHSSLVFDQCTFYLNKSNSLDYREPQFINCTFYNAKKELIAAEYNGYYLMKPISIQATIETPNPAWEDGINDDGIFEPVCVDTVFISTSSTLEATKTNNYKATNMLAIEIDNNTLNTAWVEGVSGYGIGETITLSIKSVYPKNGNEEWPLNGDFTIINGYAKSKSIWKNNSRVKQFNIYRNNKLVAKLTLKDSPNVQKFNLGDIIGKNNLNIGERLTFEIAKVYKGNKYKDTAITYFSPGCSP